MFFTEATPQSLPAHLISGRLRDKQRICCAPCSTRGCQMNLWSNTAVFKWNVSFFFFCPIWMHSQISPIPEKGFFFFYKSQICTNFMLEEFFFILPQLELESRTNILESHKTVTQAQVVSLHTVDTQKAWIEYNRIALYCPRWWKIVSCSPKTDTTTQDQAGQLKG